MRFSIIIPVYNAEKYIDNALRSFIEAASKTGTVDFEVLLIEDGSSDGSYAKCDKYAEKYSFIKAFHVGKTGPFRARREGMKYAKGDWLIFADSDDELSVDAIPRLSKTIDEWYDKGITPDIIVYNAADFVDRKDKLFKFPFTEHKLYDSTEKRVFYDIMSSSDALNAMWNKCVRRELVLGTDSFDGISLNHGEDLLQTAEFIDKAESIVYLDECLYYYRQNSNGLTGNYHKEFMPDQITAWGFFDKYVSKWSREAVPNDYEDILRRRKTLTCAIGVKSLIYSGIKLGDKKTFLKAIMELPFYAEYAKKELPKWAPEEDAFVHELMLSGNAYSLLIKSAIKHDIKVCIKRLLKRV
ncbi:glycosyltransferase family 2 protein [Butyrivibrio sp. YAB3001]|uniref:glycosyltransferase family 2 protein n=1 Tax=Butyrivibrio sp. YAB3001 TaxID=1520812 RepID=UPI0008F66C72|nr:glycosyltransferase family 2 protein [Butyrivibrio sp. YAB3001]SFC77071.1 Glycosyltransferase involved in cell wall bisynthesis [Butyrivibrio sp. YAB3001]